MGVIIDFEKAKKLFYEKRKLVNNMKNKESINFELFKNNINRAIDLLTEILMMS